MKRKPSAAAIRAFVAQARALSAIPSKIPGGKAARRHPRNFDAAALENGTGHELEHTSSLAVAMEIAMDHLVEDHRYYEKLDAMERRPQTTSPTTKVLGGRIVKL